MELDPLIKKSKKILESSEEIVAYSKDLKEMLEQLVIKTQLSHADSAFMCLVIFILSCFVGYYVVSKVIPSLHSPLMSVTNAISSVIIVAAIIATASGSFGMENLLGGIAVFFAAVNVVGGFVITQRMLTLITRSKDQSHHKDGV
jgi:NAD(P) transhydrogenase subunit alpha